MVAHSGTVPGDRWTTRVTRFLAPNPSPMTLEGTNTYLVRAPGSESVVVVDPGPADTPGHLARLTHVRVELILITHHHQDHAGSAVAFAAATGAPVRAFDAELCVSAAPLQHGELIHAASCRIRVVATPGHTADSICLHLPDDAPFSDSSVLAPAAGSMLTGDTILGRGTTVIAPGGSLEAYMRSLVTLRSAGQAMVLPGHGPMRRDLEAVCDEYLEHRRGRLEQVVSALEFLGLHPSGDSETVTRVAQLVYSGIVPDTIAAAEASTRAQLEYLEARHHC